MVQSSCSICQRDAIADESNIEDPPDLQVQQCQMDSGTLRSQLLGLGRRVRCRTFGGLPNVWFDVSSVCESDAIAADLQPLLVLNALCTAALLCRLVPYGESTSPSDTPGHSFPEGNHSLELSHCNQQMTFVRYEQLRAIRGAVMGQKLSLSQIEDLFFNTAFQLVKSVRDKQREASSADIVRQDLRTRQYTRSPLPLTGREGIKKPAGRRPEKYPAQTSGSHRQRPSLQCRLSSSDKWPETV